jgi:MFS transporter, ACS family, glucarate transporter
MSELTDGSVHDTALDWELDPGPPSRVRYRVLALACALAVVTYIHRIGFAVGAPAIKKSLDLDDAQVGYLMAAFMGAYGSFQVPGGVLGDRFGGRHVLTILVLEWSLATAAVALAALVPGALALPFVFLLVLRFLFGMFQAGGFPTLGRVIADWMPVTERGFAQGSIWMFSRWGGALVPFLLVWLFRVCGSWPVPFVLIAGLGFLWCGAFWPWFRDNPQAMRQVNRGELKLIAAGRPKVLGRPEGVPWSRMVGSKSVWSLCLMYGLTGFSGNFFTSMLPLYLSAHRHLSPEGTAWLSALPLAGGSVACILGGTASDWAIRHWGSRKWGRRYVGLVGLGLAGPAFLATIWAEQVWVLALLLTATFFCNDLTMGPAWAACADIGERFAGTLSGAMNMASALAGACGAAMAGYLFRQGHPELVFMIFAGAYVLAALCWLGVDVTRRLADAPDKEYDDDNWKG